MVGVKEQAEGKNIYDLQGTFKIQKYLFIGRYE